jgi:ubiquinone biosynthesis protein
LTLRYSLDELFLQIPLCKKLYFLHWLNPFYFFYNRFIPRGKRLTSALQKAGPVFIKFGQMLSTRQDFLPKDIIQHLIRLQDKVPPFPSKIAHQLIDKETNNNTRTIFSHIANMPLASASIAQVHAATLKNGTEVVIKILRPNIQQALARDLALLHWGAKFFKPWGTSLVTEIETTLKQEINLINEAAHAQKIKENSEARKCTDILIPTLYWEYCTEHMLVMERIYGTPIMDVAALHEAKVDPSLLAKKCVTVFFRQIFQDNYFHADLHPGNIFINITQPSQPVIELVDFGIVGSLPLKDRRYIAENMTALIDKDYRKVARLHRESGWTPPYVPEIAFAYAIQKVCEPILNKALKDISLAQLLLGLLQAARQYEIQLQPQLLLLQKTLLNIESLCRHLDPQFNIWDTIQPILENWLRQQMCPIATMTTLVKYVFTFIKDIE